jgi:hypothetical protein
MKRQSLLVLALILGLAGTSLIAVRASSPATRDEESNRATDGAFRDGLFQGKLDAQSGREPHIATGRWSTGADRASFTSGYQRGYRELSQAHAARLAKQAKLAAH